jgi:hypothetical protein
VGLEVRIAAAIGLEASAVAVVPVAVHFDHDALAAPEEVDRVALHRALGLETVQVGLAHQREHAVLRLALGHRRLLLCLKDGANRPRPAMPGSAPDGVEEVGVGEQAPGPRLAVGSLGLARRADRGQIEDGAGRGGDGQAVAAGAVGGSR